MKEILGGFQVLITGNKCFRCGHGWVQKEQTQRAKVCPKCKNPYWDTPKKDKGGDVEDE